MLRKVVPWVPLTSSSPVSVSQDDIVLENRQEDHVLDLMFYRSYFVQLSFTLALNLIFALSHFIHMYIFIGPLLLTACPGVVSHHLGFRRSQTFCPIISETSGFSLSVSDLLPL